MKTKIDFSKLALQSLWYQTYPSEVNLEVLNWFIKTGNAHREKSGWYEFGVSQHLFGYSANEHNAYFPLPILYQKINGEYGSMNIDVLGLFFQSVFVKAVLTEGSRAVDDWRRTERIALGNYRMLDFPIQEPEPEVKSKCYGGTHSFLKTIVWYVGNGSPLVDIKLSTIGNGYICEFSLYKGEKNTLDQDIYSHYNVKQEKGESIACFINKVLLKIESLLGADFFAKRWRW